ncbi:hypothetical protein ACWF95_37415 [Streptomyces vinaceus]
MRKQIKKIGSQISTTAHELQRIVASGPATPVVTALVNNREMGPKPKFTGMAPGATQVLVQNTNNTAIVQVDVRGDGCFLWVQPDAWALHRPHFRPVT